MRVPKFENIEEEAEFWDTTDTSEILNTGKHIGVEWDTPGICPLCQSEDLRYRYIDIDLLDGAITLHGMEVYYCPKCKKTIVPKGTQARIKSIIKHLQQLEIEEISAIVNAI